MKIALVVSDFNFDVTSLMAGTGAPPCRIPWRRTRCILFMSLEFSTCRAVKKLLKRKDIDAVVLIGAVIKGDTITTS